MGLASGRLAAPSALPAGTALAYPPFWDGLPLYCETGFFSKGPQVLLTGHNTEMKLVWQLDSTRTSVVQWGSDGQYALGTVAATEAGPDHRFAYTLGGLTPGAQYNYRIIASPACYEGSFYAPPPDTATSLKFFAYGDTRNGIGVNDTIAGQIMAAYAADPAFQTLVLGVGDLVSEGDNESAWTSEFFDPYYWHLRSVMANLAYLSARGNHEGSAVLFGLYFPMPFVNSRYWSFDYGPIHVAMVDQYVPYGAGSAQHAWLETDLAASHKTWKFIVLHEPGWSAGGAHPDNATVQREIEPLAERYGVSMVFAGHNHYYARAVVNGIQHLTVGGGGAPLYTPNPHAVDVVAARSVYSFAEIVISGNVLTGTALEADGTLIETFTLTR